VLFVTEDIISRLNNLYPNASCALDFSSDYELLFAARLAAQCTDARVNTVTPVLFGEFPTLEALAGADIERLEEIVHSCGFYRQKARDIKSKL
jgi:endonuclease-3